VHALQTNDLIELKSNTSFIWKGRADFVINTGGIKVYPEELESQLSATIEFPFFIGCKVDPLLGQKIILIIESEQNQGFKKSDFSENLSKYALPKEIFYLPYFMRTESGKINRNETLKLLDKYAIKEVL
jgi:O-succinylbenzoic acid--CoA ligase